MIDKGFIDSDIILDVALAREPFLEKSKMLLSTAANNLIIGFTSSLCIANVYYFMRKYKTDKDAREFLSTLLSFLTVLPIEHDVTLNVLQSEFSDFEDALQYYTAMKNQCNYLITRNSNDYKKSLELNLPVKVLSPDDFLRLILP
jgi:predicted nucleic acid-binding protein